MIHLRDATQNDAAKVLEIYAPIVRDTAISFELEPPSLEEMQRRISEIGGQFPWLIAEHEEVLGYAYGSAFRPRAAYRFTAEVTVYVAPRARRTGVGRALLKELVAQLEARNYRSLIGAIALPNDASVRLHEALGFQRIAVLPEVGFKFGAWHDVGYWQLLFPTRPVNEVIKGDRC